MTTELRFNGGNDGDRSVGISPTGFDVKVKFRDNLNDWTEEDKKRAEKILKKAIKLIYDSLDDQPCGVMTWEEMLNENKEVETWARKKK